MAIVNVYIQDPYVKKYLIEEKISEISFIGNLGGLLGLFLGFSFVSVFEIIYYAFVIGACRKCKERKESKVHPASGLQGDELFRKRKSQVRADFR